VIESTAMALILPFATVVLAAVVTFVAVLQWRVAVLQWRVAGNKLRLDLFDRRYKVYEAIQKFVDSINSDPEHVISYLNDFNVGTSNAEFLFEADVLNYIKLVREKAVDMLTARNLYERERDDEERTRNIKKYGADRKWLVEQAKTMTKTFAPYLGFSNVKI
jgi:hypothetical protein